MDSRSSVTTLVWNARLLHHPSIHPFASSFFSSNVLFTTIFKQQYLLNQYIQSLLLIHTRYHFRFLSLLINIDTRQNEVCCRRYSPRHCCSSFGPVIPRLANLCCKLYSLSSRPTTCPSWKNAPLDSSHIYI